jgi:hypothetical protein
MAQRAAPEEDEAAAHPAARFSLLASRRPTPRGPPGAPTLLLLDRLRTLIVEHQSLAMIEVRQVVSREKLARTT